MDNLETPDLGAEGAPDAGAEAGAASPTAGGAPGMGAAPPAMSV